MILKNHTLIGKVLIGLQFCQGLLMYRKTLSFAHFFPYQMHVNSPFILEILCVICFNFCYHFQFCQKLKWQLFFFFCFLRFLLLFSCNDFGLSIKLTEVGNQLTSQSRDGSRICLKRGFIYIIQIYIKVWGIALLILSHFS